MFQFPRFPSASYGFRYRYHPMKDGGLPHSDTCGSKSACNSPQHFGACPVLHRPLAPRHPPCALDSLTYPVLGCISTTKHSCSKGFPLRIRTFTTKKNYRILRATLENSTCRIYMLPFLCQLSTCHRTNRRFVDGKSKT